MKIIGGNFGVKGSAYISRDNMLVVEGAIKGIYSPDQIQSISTRTSKEKKFGIIGFILGAIILSVILGIFLGILGVGIALIVAISGSFYSEKSHIVEVKFTDDKSVTLECTPRRVNKLVRFSPQVH